MSRPRARPTSPESATFPSKGSKITFCLFGDSRRMHLPSDGPRAFGGSLRARELVELTIGRRLKCTQSQPHGSAATR